MKERRTARPEENPSPISGRGLFAARPPNAGPRFRSIALRGSLVVGLRARATSRKRPTGGASRFLSIAHLMVGRLRFGWLWPRQRRAKGRFREAGGHEDHRKQRQCHLSVLPVSPTNNWFLSHTSSSHPCLTSGSHRPARSGSESSATECFNGATCSPPARSWQCPRCAMRSRRSRQTTPRCGGAATDSPGAGTW